MRFARFAWPLGALWLLVWLALVALTVANGSAIRPLEQADTSELILPIGFAMIGTLLASRKPDDPTG